MSKAVSQPALWAKGVSKRYAGVQALDKVSVEFFPGEVVAIIGENGAGKSTLMKILSGVVQPDEGKLFLNGEEVRFPGPRDAMAKGISLIHQELNLAENLSIADNLYLGREIRWAGPLGLIDHAATRKGAAGLLSTVGLRLDPGTLVGQLSPGQKQLVEIARSLSLTARFLIMDEPTSSLTQKETDQLEAVVRELKSNGVCVIYITHRLAEVRRMADRVVGLRDGKNAGSLDRNQISHDSLIKLMVGREIKPPSHSEQVVTSSKAVLRLEDLRYAQSPLPGISLEVKSGEILGMAGLMGAGRTELSECVFGLRKRVGGKVILNGSELPANDVRSSIKQGMALVPEDRRGHGLLLETGVGYNLSLPNLDWLNWFGVVRPGSERRMVGEQIKNMGVKTTNASKPVGMLSGGNQQKVVLGKWLARQPKLLILDEPTRGVDVGAREEIYRIMRALAANGIGILMISSDMEEVLSVSDRILVMHEGALSGELHRNQFSEEAVMSLATGKPAEEKTADHIGYGRG